jgi:hypothetical protein
MVATKTALTGGNGSRHSGEAFGDSFELPPDRAYNETCAAIASFQWSWRLLLATGDGRYADLMERVLYNVSRQPCRLTGGGSSTSTRCNGAMTTSRTTILGGGGNGFPAPAARRTSCG